MLVVGKPGLADRHVRAWKLAGVEAEKIAISQDAVRSQKAKNKDRRICLDVCVSNFAEKARLIKNAQRSEISVVTTEPVYRDYGPAPESSAGVSVLDSMRYHPLLSKVVALISSGRVGPARILRLEALSNDKDLSDFSYYEALVNGVSAAHILLQDPVVKNVFARKVKTEYSSLCVALLSFNGGAICQLQAGNSKNRGLLEFSINGPGGMIAFNENESLVSGSELDFSDSMKATTSVEVLRRMFADFLSRKHFSETRNQKKYQVVKAIEDSARQQKSISTFK